MQRRIGYIFTAFPIGLIIIHIIMVAYGMTSEPLVGWRTIFYAAFSAIMILTIFWESKVSKAMQVTLATIAGIITLRTGAMYFGCSILFIALMVAFAYGFYSVRPKLRGAVTLLTLFLLLVFVPQELRIINAFLWTVFFCGFTFLMWVIFKDELDKIKRHEHAIEARLLNQLKQSIELNVELINISKQMHEKLEGKCNDGDR
jgi:hypothetical protein